MAVAQRLDNDGRILSLLLWFEAHDLAYKTTRFGYGTFALGALHVA